MSPTKVDTPRCCLQVDHLVTSLEVSSTNSSLHVRFTLTAILGKVLLCNHHGVLPHTFHNSAQFVTDVVVLRADW